MIRLGCLPALPLSGHSLSWKGLVLAALMLASPVFGFAADSELVFERDVRPLLKQHCFHCHGEEPELSGGLDTRLVRFLIKGGESGTAIVPGNHAQSLLFQRIAAGEMPPGGKPIPAEELAVLAKWIDQGGKTARPEPLTVPVDDFTPEERNHWSFQPIVRPAVPDVADAANVPNADPLSPIDRFIQARLHAQQLTPSAEADRLTLIRRLSFNLRGLPPSRTEVEAFLNDSRADAYARLVDQFLEDPAYGERWGRHWLDIAGYADSDGYSAKDLERKWSWKYRDYVIRSFNIDKPWNEFIVEQLAGDELLTPPFDSLTEDQAEKLIATGFLRMGPDGTGDGSVDQPLARNDAMAETIKIVSTSLLGLTVGCAQCHNHRYDPISQVDYHRIRSIFEPAYNAKAWKAPNARLISQWSAETRQKVTEVEAELAKIQAQRNQELDEIIAATLERELAKLPEEVREPAKAARDVPVKERTPEQVALIKEYPFLNVNRGTVYLYQPDRLTGFNKKWDALTAEKRSERPGDDLIHCLTEVPGQHPLSQFLFRGDHQQPRQTVMPGELAVLGTESAIPEDDPQLPTSGRRLAYARLLTNGQHPLVARVIVNRVWLNHFGRGLVATPGDFGFLGEAPSHPELLDWLAAEFMENGWHLKPLHRAILNSVTYRQTSAKRDDLERVDPDNRLLGRMNVRRLEAEVIRDSILAASGKLTQKLYGAAVPVTPDDVGQVVVGVDTRDSAGRPSNKVVPLGEEEYRRSIYVSSRRTLPLGMLEPFDAPLMTPNCEQRNSSTVAPQSLLLMNNSFVVQQSLAMAEQLQADFPENLPSVIEAAWWRTFSRSPSTPERDAAQEYVESQVAYFSANPPQNLPKGTPKDPRILAVATLCQAFTSSSAFLYVD